jgi:hypothetical protein
VVQMVLRVVDISHRWPGAHRDVSMESTVSILETQLHLYWNRSDTQMEQVATLILAIVGAACIYAGYRLFCGLPALNNPNRPTNRLTVFLMNIVPGALLALFGTVLLTTQARAMVSHRPNVEHRLPSTEGTAWHPSSSRAFNRAA